MNPLLRGSLPAILGLGLFAATLGAEFGVLWAWHAQSSRAYPTASAGAMERTGSEVPPGGGGGDGAGLLERLPGPEPGRPPLPEVRRVRARLAIVIDDWGYDWHAADAFFALDAPITVAIIPFLPHSRQQALEARRRGFEVLVHLPMEPEDPRLDPGAGAITTDLPDEEIQRRVERAIEAIPGAVGVSNHMGSKATSERRVMAQVLAVVARRGLFFLDSRTTPHSVVGELASEMGMPWAVNNLFLDGDPEPRAVRGRLELAARRALARGQAVVIGHVRASTAAAIASALPELRRMGVDVVPVSALLQRGARRPANQGVTVVGGAMGSE